MMMLTSTKWILAGLLLATTIDQGVMAGFAGQVEYENLIEDSFSNSASLDSILRAIAEEAKLFEMQKRYQDATDAQSYEVSAKMEPVTLEAFDEKLSVEVGWEGKEDAKATPIADEDRHLKETETKSPFDTTFVLRAVGEDVAYMAGIFEGSAPLKIMPCIHAESSSNCGVDTCVSLMAQGSAGNETVIVPFASVLGKKNGTDVTVNTGPDGPTVDMYLRKVGDRVKWLEVEDAVAMEESSFCMRPGYASPFSISLVPVTALSKLVQQDVDSNFLMLLDEGDVSDDYASFRLLKPSTTCKHGSDCAGGFFCHKESCYPKRDEDQLCDLNYHCKSGECKLDRVGNLIDGFFIRVCSEPPAVE